MTKVAIVYYSFTGHGTEMAKKLAAKAEELGAEVRLRPIADDTPEDKIAAIPPAQANAEATADLPRATGEDLEWADVVLLGSPTRFSNVAHQFQAFVDTLGGLWSQGKLADKVYAAFTSSQTEHGGQETTLQTIYQMVMHWGGFIVSPGYTAMLKFADGNPYGVSHVTGPENTAPISEATSNALDHLVERAITVSQKLTA